MVQKRLLAALALLLDFELMLRERTWAILRTALTNDLDELMALAANPKFKFLRKRLRKKIHKLCYKNQQRARYKQNTPLAYHRLNKTKLAVTKPGNKYVSAMKLRPRKRVG